MMESSEIHPAEVGGYGVARFNALRHGVLSRYTVLPWEDPAEYHTLVAALVADHMPQGPTEEHLVEELAGIIWRKRRLRLAEAASHRRGLERTLSPYSETVKTALVHLDTSSQIERVADAICATQADTDAEIAEMNEDEAMTRRAVGLLGTNRNDAYEAAMAELRDDTREWWLRVVGGDCEEDEEPYRAEAADLRRFLDHKVLDWFETRRRELANRPLIREQAFGEALDPGNLDQLGRYEVHLDRKLERMLSMLLRLKDLRRAADFG